MASPVDICHYCARHRLRWQSWNTHVFAQSCCLLAFFLVHTSSFECYVKRAFMYHVCLLTVSNGSQPPAGRFFFPGFPPSPVVLFIFLASADTDLCEGVEGGGVEASLDDKWRRHMKKSVTRISGTVSSDFIDFWEKGSSLKRDLISIILATCLVQRATRQGAYVWRKPAVELLYM